MKPELEICQVCPIKDTCHPALNPERFNNKSGKPGLITPEYYQFYFICRHYTCNNEGRKGARLAIESGSFRDFSLHNGEIISAVPFGSKDKNTAERAYRIADARGNVYSLQGGKYYPTGLNVFISHSSVL